MHIYICLAKDYVLIYNQINKYNERSDSMKDAITYKNKDVLFKVLDQNYKNKSLSAYGLGSGLE